MFGFKKMCLKCCLQNEDFFVQAWCVNSWYIAPPPQYKGWNFAENICRYISMLAPWTLLAGNTSFKSPRGQWVSHSGVEILLRAYSLCQIIRIHYTLMWYIDTCNEWGMKWFQMRLRRVWNRFYPPWVAGIDLPQSRCCVFFVSFTSKHK